MSRRIVGLVVAGFGVWLGMRVFQAGIVEGAPYEVTPIRYVTAHAWVNISGRLYALSGVCVVLGLVWLALAEWIGDRPLGEVWRERRGKKLD